MPSLIPMTRPTFEPDRHCGCTTYFNGALQPPCVRPLSCQTHSVLAKRLIQGRSKTFDELFADLTESLQVPIIEMPLRPIETFIPRPVEAVVLEDRPSVRPTARPVPKVVSRRTSNRFTKLLTKKAIARACGRPILRAKQAYIRELLKRSAEYNYLPITCRALSPIPDDAPTVTYADVLKMVIPPHTIRRSGTNMIEIVSQSYHMVESNPFDPDDPYLKYRETLPASERNKPRIKLLVRTVDEIVEGDDKVDLITESRIYHQFEKLSTLTEISYLDYNENAMDVTPDELQETVQVAVRKKYEELDIADTMSKAFSKRLSEYMTTERNSHVIQNLFKRNDMRLIHKQIEDSINGMMEINTADMRRRAKLDVQDQPEVLFNFKPEDLNKMKKLTESTLQEVEIFPEDLAQSETVCLNEVQPTETVNLDNILAGFSEDLVEPIIENVPEVVVVVPPQQPQVPKPPQPTVNELLAETIRQKPKIKRSATIDSFGESSSVKKMRFNFENPKRNISGKKIPATITSADMATPMIIDETIDDNFMNVDQADMNEIIDNNLMYEPIYMLGTERNASPIDFLFDMDYQNQSLSDSDDDEESGEFFFFMIF